MFDFYALKRLQYLCWEKFSLTILLPFYHSGHEPLSFLYIIVWYLGIAKPIHQKISFQYINLYMKPCVWKYSFLLRIDISIHKTFQIQTHWLFASAALLFSFFFMFVWVVYGMIAIWFDYKPLQYKR